MAATASTPTSAALSAWIGCVAVLCSSGIAVAWTLGAASQGPQLSPPPIVDTDTQTRPDTVRTKGSLPSCWKHGGNLLRLVRGEGVLSLSRFPAPATTRPPARCKAVASLHARVRGAEAWKLQGLSTARGGLLKKKVFVSLSFHRGAGYGVCAPDIFDGSDKRASVPNVKGTVLCCTHLVNSCRCPGLQTSQTSKHLRPPTC